jgi:Domain of unknown function (DUF4351)
LSQYPYDEFSKNFLETLCKPLGEVQAAKTVASEVREIDLYFVPHNPAISLPALGLLQSLITTPVSFEPFRNPVAIEHIKSCLVKLLDLHGEITKTAKKNKRPTVLQENLPYLWIITPTLSAQKLQDLRAEASLEVCNSGIYRLAPTLRTGIVVVHQLPITPETLWFRLLGRDGVQAKAAQELTALPLGSPYREETIQLLVSLKLQLETQKKTTSKDRKLIMNLSPLYLEQISLAEQRGAEKARAEMLSHLYLEQISQAEQRGRIEVLLRQLNRQVGKLVPALEQQVITLGVTQIGDLGEALLNFHNEEDLLLWLNALN